METCQIVKSSLGFLINFHKNYNEFFQSTIMERLLSLMKGHR